MSAAPEPGNGDDARDRADERPRRREIRIVALAALLVLATAATFLGVLGPKRAPGLTRAALLSIKIGMPESEIPAKLGPPLNVETTSHLDNNQSPVTWNRWRYATASLFYPSLSVTVLSEKGFVTGGSAKYADIFIYEVGESRATPDPDLPSLEELLD